jgi:hypothetical protein
MFGAYRAPSVRAGGPQAPHLSGAGAAESGAALSGADGGMGGDWAARRGIRLGCSAARS